MADLARIKSNVAKMASQNAPQEDIDGYIQSQGSTIDEVRNFRLVENDSQVESPSKPPSILDRALSLSPGYKGMKLLEPAYKAIREPLVDVATKSAPIPMLLSAMGDKPLQFNQRNPLTDFVPTPFKEMLPQSKSMTTGKQMGRDVAGVGVDVLLGEGAVKGVPAVAKGAIKGADKNITSVLRRVAGQSSSDIKLGRELMREGGTKAVLSKTKAKPAYLEREIVPKATELASKRVRSMNPNALQEIKVSPEGNQLAQDLKAKFNLKEFPTKSSADEFYSNTINNAPDDIQIPLDDLEKAMLDPNNKIDSRAMNTLNDYVRRTRLNAGGVTERVPLSKDEYNNIRGMLNNLDPQGETPAIQALKGALDEGASKVIPQLAEAKGRFQLSRELPKTENFLNKATSEEDMARRLSQSEDPSKVTVRDSVNRLLGPEGEPLVKDVQAQRLAKQWYGGGTSGKSLNPRANPILEAVKELARPVPRAYEKGRASVVQLFKGVNPSPLRKEIPSFLSQEKPYVQPKYSPTEEVNVDLVKERLAQHKPESFSISKEGINIAREEAATGAVRRGELPYKTPGSIRVLSPEEPISNVPYELPYSKPGNIKQSLPPKDVPNQPFELPYSGSAGKFKEVINPYQPFGESLPYKNSKLIKEALKKSRGKK